MGRYANHVCTEPLDVARIEQLVTQLPSQAQVRIVCNDGEIVTGTVTERPFAQVFESADGREGINALVRLDDPQRPEWTAYLWLSDIDRVERLDPLPAARTGS